MTQPQPKMKRYAPDFLFGRVLEDPTGDYIRFDDPALVAARDAMRNARSAISAVANEANWLYLKDTDAELARSIDGLKGPA